MGIFDILSNIVDRVNTNYNGKMRAAARAYEREHPDMSDAQREKIERMKNGTYVSRSRRTDDEVSRQPLNWPRTEASGVDVHSGSLYEAAHGTNCTGVYILWLYGQIMKCGSAEIGVAQRMNQYYNLNQACGLNKYINMKNRDQITVEWQDCPRGKCNELESKLFRKYGKGPWAERAPHSTDDTWDLLI